MMTDKEKARRYDETLEIATAAYKDVDKHLKATLERIFPELKESKDEQHRKWILEYLYDGLRKSDEQFKGQFKCAIAWLEKQSGNLVENGYTNNKDIIKYADNYSHAIWHKLMDNFKNIKDYHIGCNDVSDIVLNAIIDAYNWLEKQGEPKWKPSKEQIIALRWILNNIPYNKHKEEISGLLDQIKNYKL